MKAVYEWEAMLKAICKEKGWEENKNCKISYEARADIETDTLTFVAKIRQYAQIDEVEIKAVIE
mgnify:CR=1 FL=1